jgi:hypothetical protein
MGDGNHIIGSIAFFVVVWNLGQSVYQVTYLDISVIQ